MHVDLHVGIAVDEYSRCAGMIEMDVGDEERADLSGHAEFSSSRPVRAASVDGRTGLDQRVLAQAPREIRGDDARHHWKLQVDAVQAGAEFSDLCMRCSCVRFVNFLTILGCERLGFDALGAGGSVGVLGQARRVGPGVGRSAEARSAADRLRSRRHDRRIVARWLATGFGLGVGVAPASGWALAWGSRSRRWLLASTWGRRRRYVEVGATWTLRLLAVGRDGGRTQLAS